MEESTIKATSESTVHFKSTMLEIASRSPHLKTRTISPSTSSEGIESVTTQTLTSTTSTNTSSTASIKSDRLLLKKFDNSLSLSKIIYF